MKLPDAVVALAGTILSIEPTINFETKKPDGGSKVVIATDGEGFANVKLKPEDMPSLAPAPLQRVAWMVRYGAYSARGDNAETYVGFVRVATPGDADKLNSTAKAASAR